MAEEVDQASVDVIKTLLESKNGKLFMTAYLKELIRDRIQIKVFVTKKQYNANDMTLRIDLAYEEMLVTSATTSFIV